MHFRKKQRIKRIILSRGVIVLLAFVVLVLARGVWGVYEKERDTNSKLEYAQEEHRELTEQRAFLEEDNARLNTEHGVEEEIRDKYGLGKAGEEVIIVVSPDDDDIRGTSQGRGFWNTLRAFFRRN